jgi:hypothetical protein
MRYIAAADMHKINALTIRLFFLTGFFLIASSAHAATLSLTSASGIVGQTVSVSVLVSADGQSLNGVSANVNFPPDKLSLLSLSKAGSIVTFWAEEPNFSNSTGTASLEGIVPNPGYSGQGGRVITLVFQVKAAGAAIISFSGASVLANDGRGTNILTSASSRTIGLAAPAPTQASVSTPAPVQTPTTTEPAPRTPSAAVTSAFPIRSETHPDQGAWYAGTQGVFTWDLPSGATATRLLFDRSPDSVPSIVYEPAISEKTISGMPEGTSYLHVQYRVNGVWSGVGNYRVNIDTTPPNEFHITFPHGDTTLNPQPVILFNTTDNDAGIDRYEIRIGDGGALSYAPTADSNPYALPPQEPGSHVVTVTAYDHAGNSKVAVAGFYVEGIEPPKISFYEEQINVGDLMKFIGTTYENSTVTMYVYKDGKRFAEDVTKTNSVGNFTMVFTKRLPAGSYTATAKVADARGAVSPETDPIPFVVKGTVVDWFASHFFIALAILLSLFGLAALVLASIYGWHRILHLARIRRMRPDELVHRSFGLLRKDLETHIDSLRQEELLPSTKKEIAFLEQFGHDLSDMEAIVEKKINKGKV